MAVTVIAIAATAVSLAYSRAWGYWIASGFLIATGLGVAFIRMRYFCDATCRGPADRKCVALTFDDGPDPNVTPHVLDTLRAEGIHATFFCIGERVRACPDLARRIVQEGHLIGNHTDRHAWWTNFLFGGGLCQAIARAQETIRDATGQTPRYFRPPMGLTNPHLNAPLRKNGLVLIGWDVRTFDRRTRQPEATIRRACAKIRNGSILLLHDGDVVPKTAVHIVKGIIDELRVRGFDIVRLDALIDSPATNRDFT